LKLLQEQAGKTLVLISIGNDFLNRRTQLLSN
jgi:hypothetical protein